jgi:light-regulated signal transduction histidine kinase (bacteriophytochrome)
MAQRFLDARVQARTGELERSNQELQRLNEALNEFAYSASHDLQQPLRTMATQSQLLQRKYLTRLDAEAHAHIQTIVRAAHSMNAMLADLLAYSRSVHLQPRDSEAIDASAVAHEALTNLQAQVQEARGKITIGKLPAVHMHHFHLLELFQNLIGNALKYRSEDTPEIQIDFRDVPEPTISVRDNGIGIEAKYAAQVFGLFKRLHPAEAYEGTGVGLTICQTIVERYGGRIWVEPNAPKGSSFCFTVPMQARNAASAVTKRATAESA